MKLFWKPRLVLYHPRSRKCIRNTDFFKTRWINAAVGRETDPQGKVRNYKKRYFISAMRNKQLYVPIVYRYSNGFVTFIHDELSWVGSWCFYLDLAKEPGIICSAVIAHQRGRRAHVWLGFCWTEKTSRKNCDVRPWQGYKVAQKYAPVFFPDIGRS